MDEKSATVWNESPLSTDDESFWWRSWSCGEAA